MPGRHRKPTNTSLCLARTGALTVMMTAPLAVVAGTAAAAPSPGGGDAGGWDSQDHPETVRPADDPATRTVAMTRPLAASDSDSGDDDADSGSDGDDSDSSDSSAGRGGDDSGSGSDDTFSDDAISDDSFSDDNLSDDTVPARRAGTSQAKWDKLAQCESTQNWDADTGNGFKGGLQFTDSTWRGFGGKKFAPTADQASREQQIEVAKKVQSEQGWSAWPSCSRKLGLGD